MKKYLKILIFALLIWLLFSVILYLGCAYVLYELNVKLWPETMRYTQALFTGMAFVAAFIISACVASN